MSTETKRPNVLVIMTDQQRPDTIAALGNPIIKTPNLDRIANGGTAFLRAYSPAPVCGPARHCVATGVPPHLGHKVENMPTLRHDLTTYHKLLHDEGYQTGSFGVLNYSRDGIDDVLDQKHEYEDWFKEQGITHTLQPTGRTSEYYYIPQVMPCEEKYSKTHHIADRAIDFLRKRDKDRPFCVGAHFGKPHPPWAAPFPWQYLYRGPEMPHVNRPANYKDYQCRANRYQNRYKFMEDGVLNDTFLRTMKAAYYAMISYVDSQIGRILDELGDEMDNTLILFSCDHGEMLGDYGCVGKRCMLEPSVRLPMLARLPGFVPEGHKCRAACGLIDFMPTICDVTGLPVPEQCCEGVSLRQVAKMDAGDRIVFSQLSRIWNGQYFAADGIGTYAYSAADKREWYFNVRDELDQGPILPLDERGHKLKQASIDRHRNDEFSAAVDGDDWRDYDVPMNMLETDPDYGFLMAEPKEEIQAAVDALGPGYARNVTEGISQGHPMAEHLTWFPPEEEERWTR